MTILPRHKDVAKSRLKMSNPWHLLAVGFGSGLSPIVPGTMGSLAAILSGIWWPFALAALLAGGDAGDLYRRLSLSSNGERHGRARSRQHCLGRIYWYVDHAHGAADQWLAVGCRRVCDFPYPGYVETVVDPLVWPQCTWRHGDHDRWYCRRGDLRWHPVFYRSSLPLGILWCHWPGGVVDSRPPGLIYKWTVPQFWGTLLNKSDITEYIMRRYFKV